MTIIDTGQVPTVKDEIAAGDTVTPVAQSDTTESQPGGPTDKPAEDADTFPREYVETLRKESADHRTKGKAAEERADALSKRLHRELVTATGRLENPDDLPFDADHLDDADKLAKALDALLADRPYFAKRKVAGDAGQGARGGADNGVNLLDLLRGNR